MTERPRAMNPHQKNKVDISVRIKSALLAVWPSSCSTLTHASQSLSPDEQRLFRLYGKLPNKKDLLQNKLKVGAFLGPSMISYIAISYGGRSADLGYVH